MRAIKLVPGERIRSFRVGKHVLFYVWTTPNRIGISRKLPGARHKILMERGRF